MRPLVFFAALLVVPVAFAPASALSTVEQEFLVGYEPDQKDEAFRAIRIAGGTVEKSNDDIHVAIARTSDSGRFLALTRRSSSIQYVEANDPTSLHGAQWDGATWNGATWNGATWNGATGNGATWNGATWNGATWNGDPTGEGPDPGFSWQWGLSATNVPGSWSKTTGTRSATLCVIDSGVQWDHPDLARNMWTAPDGSHGYNALNESTWPYDDAGHGTHVAGIAAAGVENDFGIAGVGNVRIMAAKVLDANGHGEEGDLAFAIAWCATNGAKVALMALGATEPGPTLDRALAYAAERDVLLVASAGNGGDCVDCVGYPASDPRVVAVSATTTNNTLAPFSSRGPEVELATPGVDVISTFTDSTFAWGSGTSQSAALAAGGAALLRDYRPQLTADDARAQLARTATDLGTKGVDDDTGHGLLNLKRAIWS